MAGHLIATVIELDIEDQRAAAVWALPWTAIIRFIGEHDFHSPWPLIAQRALARRQAAVPLQTIEAMGE